MNKVFLQILILSSFFLSACATSKPKPLSREEYLQTTTREYTGFSQEEVISAAEEVLKLADGDDFIFSHTKNGFSATRNWSVYVVLAAAMGTDFWQFQAVPQGDIIKAEVIVSTSSSAISGAYMGNGIAAPMTIPAGSASVAGNALYDLFWSRLDYILGTSDKWRSCKEQAQLKKVGVIWGNDDGLCNSFNVKDMSPKE
ncbi:MAG: hypothetical protein H6855_06760 [Rhodospirillales bacterium]|nr:hypothetical protein [Rhodospirillales bacterium]